MRRTSALVLTGLVAGLLVAAPSTPAAGAPEATPVRWGACGVTIPPGFECARYDVPLDHDDPDGPTVQLSLVWLPAGDPERRLGSILFNPGGPGGSGVDFVAGLGPLLYSDEVRARYDLVGFDPRGIIRSDPLTCFTTLAQAVRSRPPLEFPLTPPEEALFTLRDTQLATACQLRGGPIDDHMSTANVARDMDLLRAAVGDERLNYVGYSYGSFLGVAYANLFPDRVGRLVVDGVLDPIAWTTGRGAQALTQPVSFRLRSDVGAQDTLEEFFRLCDEAGLAGCAFAPDAAERYAALAAELKVDPITGVASVTYQNMIGLTLGYLYDSAGWSELAEILALYEELAFSDEAAATADVAFGGTYPNYVEGFPAVLCADSISPNRHTAWQRAGAAADRQYGYFGRLWTWASSPCASWQGVDADRYLGPFTADTANPVLVVGTRYDPATRYEGAVTVDELLPDSALLTVEGWGHTSLFLSACADDVVSDYLLTGATPAPGTTCTQDFAPFGVVDAAQTDRAAAREQAMEHVGLRHLR